MVVQHLKQIGKVKKLHNWVPCEVTENTKRHHFEVLSSLILSSNNETFLGRIVTCNKKWILYDSWWWPAQWLDRVEAPKPFPRPNCTKNRSWSLFGGLLLVIHYSCLNSITSEKYAQQIDVMHWKLQCLQLVLVNRMGPLLQDCVLHNPCCKSRMNWVTKFCLTHHIHLTSRQRATISSSILTTFCRENVSTTSRR